MSDTQANLAISRARDELLRIENMPCILMMAARDLDEAYHQRAIHEIAVILEERLSRIEDILKNAIVSSLEQAT